MENFIYPGTVLNPDMDRLKAVTASLENNEGYCISTHTSSRGVPNFQCPCVKYRENGKCTCGKFVPQSLAKNTAPPIPSAMDSKTITITRSPKLSELKLDDLIGRKGIVSESLITSNRSNKGYMIRLIGGDYMGEGTWFIPASSVSVK